MTPATAAPAPLAPPPPPAPATPPAPPRLTAEEFVSRAHVGRCELVDGVVKELPMPGVEHGVICLEVAWLLKNHVAQHDLGRVAINDTFVKTGPESVRGADVLFYSYERLPKGQPLPKGMHTLAPDLVVEVKSPTDLWTDVFTKLGEYLRAGVRFVVLIDPARSTVSVYHGTEQEILAINDTLTLPDVLPGFAVPVARLFA